MVNRKEILEMLSAGEINVAEATELLGSLKQDAGADAPAPPAEPAVPEPVAAAPRKKNGHRWLRIEVSNLETGQNRVRVNVPLGLVSFGLKLGHRFTDELDSEMIQRVSEALKDPELSGTIVEVEDAEDNERVHIYVA